MLWTHVMDFWWCHIVIYLLWMVQILLMFVFQDSRYPTCRLPSQTWGRPIRPWPPGLCYPIKIWRRSRCCLPLILRCGMCMKFTWNINVKHPLTQDAWMKGSGGWWRGGLVLEWVHAYQFTLIGNYMQFCWKGWWSCYGRPGSNDGQSQLYECQLGSGTKCHSKKPASCAWDNAEQWILTDQTMTSVQNNLGES